MSLSTSRLRMVARWVRHCKSLPHPQHTCSCCAGLFLSHSLDQSSTVTSRASSISDTAGLQDAAAEDVVQRRQEVTQICFDFTKGLCSRGDKCKYSHDIATIVHFNSKEKGICFDYLRNQCHRGLLCRFSHDLSNIAQQCQVRTVGKCV